MNRKGVFSEKPYRPHIYTLLILDWILDLLAQWRVAFWQSWNHFLIICTCNVSTKNWRLASSKFLRADNNIRSPCWKVYEVTCFGVFSKYLSMFAQHSCHILRVVYKAVQISVQNMIGNRELQSWKSRTFHLILKATHQKLFREIGRESV